MSFTLLFLLLFDCGMGRWRVKTLTDADTTKIDWHVQEITLAAIDTPRVKWYFLNKRLPFECKLSRLTAYITSVAIKPDRDMHLTLEDGPYHAIAEIPDPECEEVKRSGHAQEFAAVRQWIADSIGVDPKKAIKCHRKVTLTGLQFQDFPHFQSGAAHSGREMHPVLAIE